MVIYFRACQRPVQIVKQIVLKKINIVNNPHFYIIQWRPSWIFTPIEHSEKMQPYFFFIFIIPFYKIK